ncbi:ALP1-like protein [Tanacetum coccineum]
MLGSIDCMHWEWKNCPVSWQGQYGRGDKKYPTIMLEVVASQDLWIWHAFYGMAGANNDINVLDNSPLFDDLLDDLAPVVPYVVNGVQYRNGYHLADGIYPEWASFVSFNTITPTHQNTPVIITPIKNPKSPNERASSNIPTPQHPNSKNLHHISITIFVTNFPTTVSSKDLWKLCDRQGVVADVYIARKLSKSGRRFGFVRFIKNPDQANLLEDLNKIWIGSYHLFASIARFDRKQNSQPNQSHQKQSNNTKPHETGHASHTTGGRSYASVLNGKEGTQKPVLAGPITKNITLENSDLLELSDTSSVVLQWEINDKKGARVTKMNDPGKSVDLLKEGEYSLVNESDDGVCSRIVMERKWTICEILEDLFEVDCGNDTIEDNVDVNPRLTSL